MASRRRYCETHQRMLLDMHIPAWDERFLSRYDPRGLASLYEASGTEAVLVYCKSHMGLNYWPVDVGAVHPAARNRDLVGELLCELEARDIAVAAYHSVIYDNFAALEHPEWRVLPAAQLGSFGQAFTGPRYGTLCPNNPAYREYERAQITQLIARYGFSTVWFDMTFWTCVCLCPSCEHRWRQESGRPFPTVLDWTSHEWVEFQVARERWIFDFFGFLRDVAIAANAEIQVVHNMAAALLGWYTGQRAQDAAHDAFPAGDHSAGQFFVSKLMGRLASEGCRPEFMTSRTANLGSHVAVKSGHRMLTDALGAIASGTAFLFIDAIDPDGGVNSAVYEQMGSVFRTVKSFNQFVDGEPIEDIMLYYSDDACVNPSDNGKPLAEIRIAPDQLPHMRALEGLSVALQEAHLTFGVITQRELPHLSRFRVVMVPDLLRVTPEEVDAFRAYVRDGGRLYVSGGSFTLATDGGVPDDFLLADVLGCHLDGFEPGAGIYLRATSDLVAAAAHPEKFIGHGFDGPGPLATPRLAPHPSARVLAELTIPYAYPSEGSLHGNDFASIHSSPPWTHLPNPVLVDHDFGSGRCVYSAVPLERSSLDANRKLVMSIARSLLEGQPTLEATTEPNVWLTARDQAKHSRIVICLLRNVAYEPAGTITATVRYAMPAGKRLLSVSDEVSGRDCEFGYDESGRAVMQVNDLSLFTLLSCVYSAEEPSRL